MNLLNNKSLLMVIPSIFIAMLLIQACGPDSANQETTCVNPINLEKTDAPQVDFGGLFGGANIANSVQFVFQDGLIWTEDYNPQTNKIIAYAMNVHGVALNALAAGAQNNVQSPQGAPVCHRMDTAGEMLSTLSLPVTIQNDGSVMEARLWQTKMFAETTETNVKMTVYPSSQLTGANATNDLDFYFLDNASDVFAPRLEEGGEQGMIKVYSLSEFEFEIRGYRKRYLGEPGKSTLRTIYYQVRYARSL